MQSFIRISALIAAGVACSGHDFDTGQGGSAVGTRTGVDFSGARPSPSGLHGEGYTFAVRYLSSDTTTGKNLSAGEAQSLIAAGVDVVVVFEDSGVPTGYAQGVADAQEAEGQAIADGMPAGRPIYFAVDYDAQPGDQPTLDAYYDGVASVLGRARTGAYAGYYVVQRLFDDGKITYAWQTYAWSKGNWDSRAQLQQVENDITAAGDGACCDRDVAVADDFGQWGYEGGSAKKSVVERVGPIGAARNADGRLEVFAPGADNQLWHQWQATPGGSWSGFAPMKGTMTGAPAIGSNTDGRLEVFVHGADGQLWHQWQTPNATWSGFAPMTGNMTDSPVVASNADGRLEVFVRGSDGHLWHQWQSTQGTWSGFVTLNGTMTGSPAVARNADGRLEVFVRGSDAQLWHAWQVTPSGSWTAFSPMTGNMTDSPAVVRNADGRLEVFVRGSDGGLWHVWQTTAGGAWSGFAPMAGQMTGTPSVALNADGRAEVFVRGSDAQLWHQWQVKPGGSWSGFTPMSGNMTDSPTVIANADGRLEVFVRGADGSLWHQKQGTNGTWSGFTSLAGQIQ